MLPCLRTRPWRCSSSAGFHGQSRSWMAKSLSCTFVPVPNVPVEPMSTRTSPLRTFSNRACFFCGSFSCAANMISSSGMPRSMRRRFRSDWMFHLPDAVVDESQNTSCVAFSAACSCHISWIFSAQTCTLPPSMGWMSGSATSSSFGSRLTFLPSFVMLSMLSSDGSTAPSRTSSALCTSASTACFCASVASTATEITSQSGTSRSSLSAVSRSA